MTVWSKNDATAQVTVTFSGGPKGSPRGTHKIEFSVGIEKLAWKRGKVDFARLRQQAGRFWKAKYHPGYLLARDIQVITCKRVTGGGPKPKVPPIVEIVVTAGSHSYRMTDAAVAQPSKRPAPAAPQAIRAAVAQALGDAAVPATVRRQVASILAGDLP